MDRSILYAMSPEERYNRTSYKQMKKRKVVIDSSGLNKNKKTNTDPNWRISQNEFPYEGTEFHYIFWYDGSKSSRSKMMLIIEQCEKEGREFRINAKDNKSVNRLHAHIIKWQNKQ